MLGNVDWWPQLHRVSARGKFGFVSPGLRALPVSPPAEPVASVAGEHLRVCPQGLTCCTEVMEHNLSAQSRQEFDRAVRDTLNKLGTLLKLRALRFDGKFHVYNLVGLATVSFLGSVSCVSYRPDLNE
jgi:hypothetical protein